jgi:hypothetical protein
MQRLVFLTDSVLIECINIGIISVFMRLSYNGITRASQARDASSTLVSR